MERKRLVNKILVLGLFFVLLPILILGFFLANSYYELKIIHREYSTIVSKQQKDIESIDKKISFYSSKLFTNQGKTREVNLKLGINLLKRQMELSVTELSIYISSLKSSNINITSSQITNIYLNKSIPPKIKNFYNVPGEENLKKIDINNYLKKTTNINPEKIDKKIVDKKTDKKVDKKVDNSKKLKFLAKFKSSKFSKKVKQWFAINNFEKNKEVFKIFSDFEKKTRLGFYNKNIFIVSHHSPHEHKIVWSSNKSWISQKLSGVERNLDDLIVSEQYIKKFIDFQNGLKTVELLHFIEKDKKTLYSEARITVSNQVFYALIPIYGTNLSLGLKSPLNGDILKTLEGVGHSLSKIVGYLNITNKQLNNVNTSTKNLRGKFKKKTDEIGKKFLLMVLLFILFLLVLYYLIITKVKNTFIKPILHVQNVAKRIQKGEYSIRCAVNTNDELENLADTVNSMLDKIVVLIRSDEDRQKMQQDIFALLDVVSLASKGDLTVKCQVTTHELQAVVDAFNSMMNSIGQMVIKVRKSGNQVELTSKQLLNFSKEILNKAQKQAKDLDVTSRKIKALGDRSQEITRMVEQIGSIATETNTLALNASLEAVRAGNKDSGISHLAEHVRQLADGLEKTKQDIASFIGSIQLATNYSVQSMEQVLKLTKSTAIEAEKSYITAEKTSIEAEQLGKAIAQFTIQTTEDVERVEEIKGVMVRVFKNIGVIKHLITEMDTQEFNEMNQIVDKFEFNLQEYGFYEEKSALDSVQLTSNEVPAISDVE
jgi:methyl-accepting chemotaxis protein